MEAMQREVVSVLQDAAKRLVCVRALESAAICAAATGFCAASLEVAWTVAGTHPPVAAAVCFLPSVVAIVFWVSRTGRRKLRIDRTTGAALSAVCAATGLLGCGLVLSGYFGEFPKGALPGVLLPLGAILGAGMTWARGVSLLDVAALLDRRGALRERLTTAAELAASSNPDSPVARSVYGQALEAYRSRDIDSAPIWERTRTTPAVLGIVVLLCTSLAFLPSPPGNEYASEAARMAAAIEAARPVDRRKIADRLRKAARSAADDPERSRRLTEAARATEIRDRERLREILRQLGEARVDLSSLIPSELTGVADARGEREESEAAGAPGEDEVPRNGSEDRTGAQRFADSAPTDRLAGLVSVYDPEYARTTIDPAPEEAIRVREADGKYVSYTDAWSAARERAAGSLTTGAIPFEYRQLVRDYFRTERSIVRR